MNPNLGPGRRSRGDQGRRDEQFSRSPSERRFTMEDDSWDEERGEQQQSARSFGDEGGQGSTRARFGDERPWSGEQRYGSEPRGQRYGDEERRYGPSSYGGAGYGGGYGSDWDRNQERGRAWRGSGPSYGMRSYGSGYQGGFVNEGYAEAPNSGRSFYDDRSFGWPRRGYGSSGGGAESQTETRGGFRGHGPKGYQRSDERIREELNDRLTDDGDIDASDIETSVRKGEVTLTGTVPDRETKRRVEDLAESLSGVKDVQNNLRVNKQGQRSASSSSSSSSSNDETMSKERTSSTSATTGSGNKNH
jgi:hypothetical protein